MDELNIEPQHVKNMSFEDRMKYYEDLRKMKRDIEAIKAKQKPKTEYPQNDWGDEEDDGDDFSSDGRDYGCEDDGGEDSNEY
tara:strand:+ start:1650 stop:1895 length:246 start_codon:yes stop_codon:yes gene_type:complete